MTSGSRLRDILAASRVGLAPSLSMPLDARIAEDLEFDAVQLSGQAVHKSLALPDAGLISLEDVGTRVRAIADAVEIPIIVDAEAGFGGPRNVTHTVRVLERAGAAAIQFEDTVTPRPAPGAPALISREEMVNKLKAALDARVDPSVLIVARCEARASEDIMVERLTSYAEAGADALWTANPSLELAERLTAALGDKPRLGAFRGDAYGPEPARRGLRLIVIPFVMGIAAVWGMRTVLAEVKRAGSTDAGTSGFKDFEGARAWYNTEGNSRFLDR